MKKVLVISYYWPPAGGPGVQRWLKFITYLPDFGIEPVLYIPDNPSYPVQDSSLVGEVPGNLLIYRQKIQEPLQWGGRWFGKKIQRISSGIIKEHRPSVFERALIWIRGNFFIPDARVLWVKPSVSYLTEVLNKEKITTVITTGPPHSLHLIGMRLREKAGIYWIADFRDPWTTIGYHNKLRLGAHAKKKHQALEETVLNAADKILVTSSTVQNEFQALTAKPVRLITNGYDAQDFKEHIVARDRKFTLSHIGSLLSGRNPEVLWTALIELCRENEAFSQAFELQLTGVVSEDVLASIEAHGLTRFLRHKAYLPHSEAIRQQRQSQVLLLIEIDSPETRGILPGKLFEYLAARRPILSIGPEGWEAGGIIRKTGAGLVLGYNSPGAIKEGLLQWFRMYQEGNLEIASKGIEKYSREELTRSLAKELTWE